MSEKKDMLARVVEGVSDQHVGILIDVAWKLRSQNPDEWARAISGTLRAGLNCFFPYPREFQVQMENTDPRDLIRTLNRKGKKVRTEVLELFKGDEPGTFRISGDWTANVKIIGPDDVYKGSWEPFPTQDQIIEVALQQGYRIPPVNLALFLAKSVTDAQLHSTDFREMVTIMHQPLVGKDGKKYRLWLNPKVDPTDEASELSCYVGLVEAEGNGSEMPLEEGCGLVFLAPK